MPDRHHPRGGKPPLGWKTVLLIAWVLNFVALCPSVEAAETWYNVNRIVSGDTFEVEGGTLVRYSSLLAPDPLSPSKSVETYAQESLEFNRSLLEGKKVRLELGSRLRDSKGSYLAYVFLEDGTFANLKVLEAGYAKLFVEPPNLEHANELEKAVRQAREEKKGLWRFETGERHEVAYIGDQMRKEFHLPGCSELEIVPTGHRKNFTSSVEAVAQKFTMCSLCKRKPTSETTDLY